MASGDFSPALGANYQLIRPIGKGAGGEVWLARDNRSGEQVAAKLLHPEHANDRSLVAKFVAERSILMGLRHPGIVSVRDLVVEGDRLAIVMDYVEGGTLRDQIRQHSTFPPQLATRITARVLNALAAAHHRGILHRDVKPDNVLLAANWHDLTPGGIRLSDFGIARILEGQHPQSTTGVTGTPEYMAPELIVSGHCDLPADIYGAGIVWYELLAGRTPFAGPGTAFTIAHRHTTQAPPPLDVPPPLAAALSQLLDKDPTRRPTAAVAAAELRELAENLGGLPALPPAQTPAAFARPATVLRESPAREVAEINESVELGPAPDLGEAPAGTAVRAMATPAPAPAPQRPEAQPGATPPWKSPKIIGAMAGALLILIGAVVFFVAGNPLGKAPPTPSAVASATQQERPTPTGLTVSRKAEFRPESGEVTLTVTYAAQNSPLRGPFLEVIPGLTDSGQCPTVAWEEPGQRRNLPGSTGISVACGWAVDVGQIPAQDSRSITARVSLSVATDQELQQWLDQASATTATAVRDPEVASVAYPVQRLQSIQVMVPSRTVSESTLALRLVPVWPGGADELNPLLVSPSVGDPTSMLEAIAGGLDGVMFSDGCSGALAVSPNGLVVTTLTQSPQCVVNAQVGNFTGLTSNSFAIVTRGG